MTVATPVRGIADTARWVALYRAEESERRNPWFRDPWARMLAGERGAEIVKQLPRSARKAAWSFVARTVLFDQIVLDEVATGVSLVINLAAGLDTRPYRLALPPSLRWLEVDQPDLLAEKSRLLAQVEPKCQLQRVPLDLTDRGLRQQHFAGWAASTNRALVLTEGLVVYLTPEQVTELGADLAANAGIRSWATDLASPALLRIIQRDWGRQLAAGGAHLQFAPESGPEFFTAIGWTPVEIHPLLTTAARLNRLPFVLRMVSRLPGAGTFHPRRPWSAVCLLKRAAP
jgi:methyltransferase (TIGR00027 family)